MQQEEARLELHHENPRRAKGQRLKEHLPIIIKYLLLENNEPSDHMKLYSKEMIHSSTDECGGLA